MVKTLTILTYLVGGMQVDHQQLSLNSSALKPNHQIPKMYTCQGRNSSPPLYWHHVPVGTRSLAIVMIDKDAPAKHRYLWALYNIPTQRNWIEANAQLLRGEEYAINSWGHQSYNGPCLSYGKHHYLITLYALKARFYFHKQISTSTLLKEMKHRIIATATLKVHDS